MYFKRRNVFLSMANLMRNADYYETHGMFNNRFNSSIFRKSCGLKLSTFSYSQLGDILVYLTTKKTEIAMEDWAIFAASLKTKLLKRTENEELWTFTK